MHYKQPYITSGTWEEVILPYVSTPHDFYCKFLSSEHEFDAMSEKMEIYCNNLKQGMYFIIKLDSCLTFTADDTSPIFAVRILHFGPKFVQISLNLHRKWRAVFQFNQMSGE